MSNLQPQNKDQVNSALDTGVNTIPEFGKIKTNEIGDSDFFRAGIVYEKYRQNPSAQLQASAMGGKSKDFIGGRLYEKLRGRRDYVSPAQFKDFLGEFDLDDIFLGGRLYEKFARANPSQGLTAEEFQMLCANEKFQRQLLDKLRDMEFLELITDSQAQPQNTRFSRSNMPASENNTPQQQYRQCNNDANTIALADKYLNQINALDNQIDAFQAEAQAEAALKYELPEAYCDSKERMLKDHVQELKQKRHKLVRALKKLKKKRETLPFEHNVPPQQYLSPPLWQHMDPYLLQSPYPFYGYSNPY